jgi:hypothetical protein
MDLKLFQSLRAETIAPLKQVEAENDERSAWRNAFYQKKESADAELKAARAALESAPSDSNIKRFRQAAANVESSKVDMEIYIAVKNKIQEINTAATKAILRPTLERIKSSLRGYYEEIAEKDAKQAEILGLHEDARISPVRAEIDRTIDGVVNWLQRYDNLSPQELREASRWCRN